MSLRIGALFAGYGGLDMAVMDVLDAELTWYAEYDKAPAKAMAHHHPDVPNLWDVTKVDWASVEPVDIITGGSPCQDLSHAGKRKGMTDGTRSNLWAEMREAIAVHRPRLVVWENVRGALSAVADSDMEPCPRCVGGAHDRGPVLRALGRVLGDLAELGYDARWYGLRAADVGGAHGRFRVFVIAAPSDPGGIGGLEAVQHDGRGAAAGDRAGVPDESDRDALRAGPIGEQCGEFVRNRLRRAVLATVNVDQVAEVGKGFGTERDCVHEPTVAPKIAAHLASSGSQVGNDLHLLPTPAVNDMGAAYTPDQWDEWTDRMKAAHGNGNGHGKSLAIEAQRLLPTPRAGDGTKGGPNQRGSSGDLMLPSAVQQTGQDWRQYDAAIRRAETATGRPAPAPTETGPKGKLRLSPAFVEWLMMLPAGHVTDPVIGLTRNEQLKALGNGVVPPQAAAALRAYLADEAVAA